MTKPTRVMQLAALPLTAAVALSFGAVAAQEQSTGEPLGSAEPSLGTEPAIVVSEAWTRPSPMLELAGAAYMVIHNGTDTDDALIGASSPAAGVVELHLSAMDAEGMMSMQPVSEVPLPAGAEARLEPGGYHVMLIELVEPLAEGAEIELSLQFQAADPQTISVPVMAESPMSDSDDGMDMGHGEPDAEATGMDMGGDEQAEGPELVWAPLETPAPVVVPVLWTPTDLADGFSLGAADAPVVIEVWEDFQCPYCQRFSFEVKPPLVEQYVQTGDARLVFRNLAFLGDESHWAAVAASLAADQNQFWPFHDYLFANFGGRESGGYHLDRLLEMGEAVGLDMEQFRAGLVLENARERFAQIQSEAQADAYPAGINATPTVVVNGTPLASPDFATVSDAVAIELAKAATAAASDAPETASDAPEDGSHAPEDGSEEG